ncbi:hypothetical protein DPM19_13590 [Actinomadura craniellae]|uniref:Uncharacterized protein n=1 Tax=Actinomadura craniellae TaxID=2231787 RepID=A0A365H6Q3_9ACTN|nr:hypothetical protein DPM19_13590 [Actinomadura craniellae]
MTGAITMRDRVHSSAGRLIRGWITSTRVAALVITRRSSARARASQPVTSRSRSTAFASPSLSSTNVPAGVATGRFTPHSTRPAAPVPAPAHRAWPGSPRR